MKSKNVSLCIFKGDGTIVEVEILKDECTKREVLYELKVIKILKPPLEWKGFEIGDIFIYHHNRVNPSNIPGFLFINGKQVDLKKVH